MKGLEYIQATRDYVDYLERHLINVSASWDKLQQRCSDMRVVYDDFYHAIIDKMIHEHDLTKFSEHEFAQYREKFFPIATVSDDSFAEAWKHHKTHNPHHWETWTKGLYYQPNEWECHCVCMIVDWMAMGLEFGGTAQEYYEKNKERIALPAHGVKFIYEIFKRLAEKGDSDG